MIFFGNKNPKVEAPVIQKMLSFFKNFSKT